MNLISLGWLSMTFPRQHFSGVWGLLTKTFGSCPQRQGRSRWYSAHYVGDGYALDVDGEFFIPDDTDVPKQDMEDVELLFDGAGWQDRAPVNMFEKKPRPEGLVSISATALARLEGRQLPDLLYALGVTYEGRCSRVDLTLDLHDSPITVPGLISAHYRDGVISGVRGFRVGEVRGNTRGDTLYLGRRGRDGSGCFMRIYDEHVNDRGEKVTRIEGEYSAEKARQVFDDLVDGFAGPGVVHSNGDRFKSDEGERKALLGRVQHVLLSSIDFYTPESMHEKNLDRRVMASWWDKVKGFPSRIKWAPRQALSAYNLDRKREYFAKQYGAFLKMERFLRPGKEYMQWIKNLTRDAKLSPIHKGIIDIYNRFVHVEKVGAYIPDVLQDLDQRELDLLW